MNPTSRDLISAITDFYKLVVQLPYVDPTALTHPPSQGWPNINAEELRKRGRTEEVIDLLRQLPYLRYPDSEKGKKGWMIGPDSHAVAYCDGEVYDEELDRIQPTPGHCIWLANPVDTDNGAGLLLDFDNGRFLSRKVTIAHSQGLTDWSVGTITEYSVRSNRTVCLDADQYESLPLGDRWMAHSTLPATDFFRTWTNKYKKLEWMPFLKEGGEPGTALWFNRPKQEDLFDDDYSGDSDESYEPSSDDSEDDDYGSDDDPYEYDSEYESDDDDVPLDDDDLESKVQDLRIDEAGFTTERSENEIRSAEGKPLAIDRLAVERIVDVR